MRGRHHEAFCWWSNRARAGNRRGGNRQVGLTEVGLTGAGCPTNRRCGACGVTRNHAPGGLGPPSAPTTRGCLQWLDAGRTKAAKAAGSGLRRLSRPRKYGPEAQNRRVWSAAGRVRCRHLSQRCRVTHAASEPGEVKPSGRVRCIFSRCVLRRSAPPACPGKEGKTGAPVA